uniref:TF-B3 domain-containing protein n=1 Tax=Solanum lycopersicum TaxID=4081 RepID=K4AUF5_SOLLC
MVNSSSNYPNFIKIICSSDELCHLRNPLVFAKSHCKNMLSPVFLESPHGKSWEVEVIMSQDEIWIAKGWKSFCPYYSISVKSLLMFTYIPCSHFDVTIYDQSTSIIEYPIHQDIEVDEEEDVIPFFQYNAIAIEEDIPVYLQANANVIEQDKEVGEANSRSEQVNPKIYRSLHNLLNINGDKLHFEMVIKKAHSTYMTIPLRYSQGTYIINMANMRLVSEEGEEWRVDIGYNAGKVIIKGGWSAFQKDNKISNGETWRFKLIRGPIANVLQVHKNPTLLLIATN